MNEGLPWHLEEVDIPGFKGEFAVRGASALTAEFQGFLATINMLNDLQEQNTSLREALSQGCDALIWASGAFATDELMESWAHRGRPAVAAMLVALGAQWDRA